MAELSEKVLKLIEENGKLSSLEIANKLKVDHQKIIGAIKSIEACGNVIKTQQESEKHWHLTDEGKKVAEEGSHEAVVFNAIPSEGIAQKVLMKNIPNAKVGFSKAMSFGWISIDKSGPNGPRVMRKVESIEDKVQLSLQQIKNLQIDQVPESQKQELKKRKLLQEVIVKCSVVEKGSDFTTQIIKEETDLNSALLASGEWKDTKFKKYNFNALGAPVASGHYHPLLKVRSEFKNIFIKLGFTEMPTSNYVESSFWNFDALFQPQAHPARDLQDTFFVSDPKNSQSFPEDYLQKVKDVHSKGGYGSEGHHCDWKREEAQKNVLRTHTTAVSARMLYALAQNKPFKPIKYFSIDRVFRNETLDATHLAEFHQIEGIMAGRGLKLAHLMEILRVFFNSLGMTQLKFKPAYNPYTEPSMEVFGYHSGLNKWVEVGNSGMFRPEMLLPMGLPEDVTVIAWGLSLERPTMIKYGLNNIQILALMIEAYEDEKLSRTQVYFWYKRFKDGRKSIADDLRSGRPLMSRTDRNIGQVRDLIVPDRKITIDIISEILGISYGQRKTRSATKFEDEEIEVRFNEDPTQRQKEFAKSLGVIQLAIFNRLKEIGMIRKVGNWRPYELKPRDIEHRFFFFYVWAIIAPTSKRGVLHRIVTGDEKWVHYDYPKRRATYGYPGRASSSTAKPSIHCGNIMLCIWWDRLGVAYYELLQLNEKITGQVN
ncbi:FARSA [Cordylochernes scorpioides]|uniref:Phenylalanine--tRNA ligase alpha subunit n=1 Tax=Cordylochernes scorpioides TaxID=51811 RepID=A0ABY6KH77_9ARAC|nr:FARSA [Cordylochernes scorpioides]